MQAALAAWKRPSSPLGIIKYQGEVKQMEDEIAVKAMVPTATRAKALEVLDHWGVSLDDAINLYLLKIIEAGKIPFELKAYDIDAGNPKLVHAKTSKDGGIIVPRDWLDDDD